MVLDYRKKVGMRTGGIKLYDELKSDFIKQNIKMGRDKFYDFLRLHNLLVPKLKNYVTTTDSNHQFRKYKNLIKDQVPNRPEQFWRCQKNSFSKNSVVKNFFKIFFI
jgi:putative transposase